jgi:hypothetical protein
MQAAINQLSLLVHTLPTEQLTPEAATALEQFMGGPASAGVRNIPTLIVVRQTSKRSLPLLLAGIGLLDLVSRVSSVSRQQEHHVAYPDSWFCHPMHLQAVSWLGCQRSRRQCSTQLCCRRRCRQRRKALLLHQRRWRPRWQQQQPQRRKNSCLRQPRGTHITRI